MKLILLPGLDGTGILFKPFLSHLHGIDSTVIPLPMTGDQRYETLTHYVASQLPDEPFILLAESFSGPIAAKLIASGRYKIKRAIFVATFLTPPRRFLLGLINRFPLKHMMRLPFSDYFITLFLIGKQPDTTLMNDFKHVIGLVPEHIVKERIASIKNHKSILFDSHIEALYILPTHDRLLTRNSINDFKKTFRHLKVISIDGPHFILQAKSQKCVDKLATFLSISQM